MKALINKKVLLMALFLLLLLAACGGSNTNSSAKKSDSPNNNDTADNDGETYDLKLATVVNPPHAWVDMGEKFAEEVEERTAGKVKVSVHHSGTLGNDEEIMDEMQLGTIDFIVGGAQNAAPYVKQFQIFGFSYLFENEDQFREAIAPDSDITKQFKGYYEENGLDLVLLGLSGGGTRYTSHKKKDITEADDLNGVKMRLPGSPIESKIWSTLGAVPTSMPWNEVYSGVQTGVVDGFESTLSGYEGSKLFEVAPHIAETEHLYMASHFTMSKLTEDKLPDEYLDIVKEVAEEMSVEGIDIGDEYDKEIKEQLKNEGVEFSEVDKDSFTEKLDPLYDELAEEIEAEDLLEMIRELQ